MCHSLWFLPACQWHYLCPYFTHVGPNCLPMGLFLLPQWQSTCLLHFCRIGVSRRVLLPSWPGGGGCWFYLWGCLPACLRHPACLSLCGGWLFLVGWWPTCVLYGSIMLYISPLLLCCRVCCHAALPLVGCFAAVVLPCHSSAMYGHN